MTRQEFTDYSRTIEALNDLLNGALLPARTVGLSRARRLLAEIGDPQASFQTVAVAGSAGKGSTAAMIAAVLSQSGFSVGLFTSPHLEEYTERIRLSGSDISREEWVRHFNRVWPVVVQMTRNEPEGYDLGRPSFFEVIFAICALAFAEHRVHWAILEAGMGGRFDATNVVHAMVAVVTSVSLEHTAILGSTVEEIAREKSAIIKPGSIAVTGAEGAALTVIRLRAAEVGVNLIEVPRDVRALRLSGDYRRQRLALRHGTESVTVDLPSGAPYQALNAALAYSAARALRLQGVTIEDAAIMEGLELPGLSARFEVVSTSPVVILDGAQSVAGSEQLARAMDAYGLPSPRVLVFAAMKDKDVASMAACLGPRFDQVIATRVPDSDRSTDATEVGNSFQANETATRVVEDSNRAVDEAVCLAGPEGTVVVAGSLYLTGKARGRFCTVGVR